VVTSNINNELKASAPHCQKRVMVTNINTFCILNTYQKISVQCQRIVIYYFKLIYLIIFDCISVDCFSVKGKDNFVGEPVGNFINILHACFLYQKLAPKIQSQKVSRKKLLKDFRTKKGCVKC